MDSFKEIFEFLSGASYMVLAGFGMFLAYKVSIATILSVSVLRLAGKLLTLVSQWRAPHIEMLRLIEAAKMQYPLSPKEWEELCNRVRPKEVK